MKRLLAITIILALALTSCTPDDHSRDGKVQNGVNSQYGGGNN